MKNQIAKSETIQPQRAQSYWNTIKKWIISSRPRCALRKASNGIMKSNIPPRLAAQSAFPSGPLPGLHKIFDPNLEMIQTLYFCTSVL